MRDDPIREFADDCVRQARALEDEAIRLRALAREALYPPEGTEVIWNGRGRVTFSTLVTPA